jgi:hypothetical protein
MLPEISGLIVVMLYLVPFAGTTGDAISDSGCGSWHDGRKASWPRGRQREKDVK